MLLDLVLDSLVSTVDDALEQVNDHSLVRLEVLIGVSLLWEVLGIEHSLDDRIVDPAVHSQVYDRLSLHNLVTLWRHLNTFELSFCD